MVKRWAVGGLRLDSPAACLLDRPDCSAVRASCLLLPRPASSANKVLLQPRASGRESRNRQHPPAPTSLPLQPKEVQHMPLVQEELKAKKKVCIAQTAPAVRIALGEELGLGTGVNATGKMVSLVPWLGKEGEGVCLGGCSTAGGVH